MRVRHVLHAPPAPSSHARACMTHCTSATHAHARAPCASSSPPRRLPCRQVGISYAGTRNLLRGTINDVQCMKHCLMTRFGYPEDRIVVLRDGAGLAGEGRGGQGGGWEGRGWEGRVDRTSRLHCVMAHLARIVTLRGGSRRGRAQPAQLGHAHCSALCLCCGGAVATVEERGSEGGGRWLGAPILKQPTAHRSWPTHSTPRLCAPPADVQHPDFYPTRANIMRAIQWLMMDLQFGDSLFFHFSGHGSQQRDPTGGRGFR